MVTQVIPNNPLTILWTDTCTIYNLKEVFDEETYQTILKEVEVVKDEPCRMSFTRRSQHPTTVSEGVAWVELELKLFLRVGIEIHAGSVIEITRNGVTTKYRRSSSPLRYSTHQEIMLELYEENA